MRALSLGPAAVAISALAVVTASASAPRCPPDSVRVGTACIDRYEASVWLVPGPTTVNQKLVRKIQEGAVTLAALQAAGATQLGEPAFPFSLTAYPGSFPADGNWTSVATSGAPTPGVYAVSVPGVLPSTSLTWFQADQACALSGKRLPTSYEWQVATAGTPDPGDADNGTTSCATNGVSPVLTGARSVCVSAWGVHDTIGSVGEWVADWHEENFLSQCSTFLGDLSCLGDDGSPPEPGASVRGGGYLLVTGVSDGSFTTTTPIPLAPLDFIGFRCAR